MKATYNKQDDFTLVENVDFTIQKEMCFFSDELHDVRYLTVSGEDKIWLAEIQGIVDSPNWNRYEFEFTFKRTSKKRFEFTLTRLYWPEMFEFYEEDEDEEHDAYIEKHVLFKWVSTSPDWILTEAVKRHTGYFELKDADDSLIRHPHAIDRSNVPF